MLTAAVECLPAAWAAWICRLRSNKAHRDCQTARWAEPPNNRAAEPPSAADILKALLLAGLFLSAT